MNLSKKIRGMRKRISNYTKNILTTQSYPTLDYGTVDPEIHGNLYPYCQNMLKQIYLQTRGADTLFTITPVCEYQIKENWPEPPFVNINIENSTATEKYNWLGYIPIDYSEIDFEQILKDNGTNFNVHGHVKKDGSNYNIYLNISDKYSTLDMYAQMTNEQRDYIVKLAQSINDYYIVTKPIKDSDGKHYTFYYRDKLPIASASAKKIDAWLQNGEKIAKANLRIHKFRQVYEGAKKPYTNVSLVKQIYLDKPT